MERRLSDQSVWLRTWEVSATDAVLTATEPLLNANSGLAFAATDVDVTVTASSPQFVVASAALPTGLRVQVWKVDANGLLDFHDQFDAPVVGWTSPELSSAPVGVRDVMVGVRGASGAQTLLSFHVTPGGDIRRGGTVDGWEASALSLFGHAVNEQAVVMHRSGSGSLYLSSYRTNYSPLQ